MEYNQWFVVEDPQEDGEEPWDFDAAELAFIAALQARSAYWRVPPAHSMVCRPEDDSSLLVSVSLSDNNRLSLGEWAVHFYGTPVRAGKVRDQLFNLHQDPERGFFHATGTVEELAERCADMFENVLNRPVSRTEWHNQGRVYATSWDFADTLEGLVGGPYRDLAPTPRSRWGDPRVRHDQCVLVRGATEPQEGPHSPLCPYAPETPAFPRR